MHSGYGIPVIFLQSQQQTDWPMLLATAISAIAAVIAAAIAVRTLRDSKSPNVIARIAANDDHNELFFIVENIGGGPAYDISIEASEPISPVPEDMETLRLGFVGRGIPLLVAGDKRETELCEIDEYYSKMRDRENEVAIRFYRRPKGRLPRRVRKTMSILDAYSFVGFKVDSLEKRSTEALERIAECLGDDKR